MVFAFLVSYKNRVVNPLNTQRLLYEHVCRAGVTKRVFTWVNLLSSCVICHNISSDSTHTDLRSYTSLKYFVLKRRDGDIIINTQ